MNKAEKVQEILKDCLCVLVTLLWVDLEALEDDALEISRDLGVFLAGRRWFDLKARDDLCDRRVSFERRFTSQ